MKKYFSKNEEMGMMEEALFKHQFNEDLELWERTGFSELAPLLIVTGAALGVKALSIIIDIISIFL